MNHQIGLGIQRSWVPIDDHQRCTAIFCMVGNRGGRIDHQGGAKHDAKVALLGVSKGLGHFKFRH